MGYLRFLAVIDGLDDTASLHDLPPSMPWRAYRTADRLVLIDWLRRPNPNNLPRRPIEFPKVPTFSNRPSGVGFSASFGRNAPGFDALYANLEKQRMVGSVPAVAVHSALLLNQLTQCAVLSLASDDDDWDFACEARDGVVQRITFSTDDEDIHVDHQGNIEIVGLLDTPRGLHRIVQHEAGLWSQGLLGLFGFDGGAESLKLSEIDRASLPLT